MLLSGLADIFTPPVISQVRDLTFILGSKCKNGVVLIGDRKVTGGSASSVYQEKIFHHTDLDSVVWGGAGYRGYVESYRYFVETGTPELKGPEGNRPLEARKFMALLLSVHGNLVDIYHSKFESNFGILIGMRTMDKRKESILHDTSLYLIENGGGHKLINYEPVVIGSGGPYAKFFLKLLWNKSMTMMEVAELGSFIIKTIQELHLSDTVGLDPKHPKDKYPQVFFIPNIPQPDGSKNGKKVKIRLAYGTELRKLNRSSNRKFERVKDKFKKFLNQ